MVSVWREVVSMELEIFWGIITLIGIFLSIEFKSSFKQFIPSLLGRFPRNGLKSTLKRWNTRHGETIGRQWIRTYFRRLKTDHFRNVVWITALEKAGFEYRPPIQTRHTFATLMLSAGEDIGWVQNMLGHSSLQMIFTRYYAWIPKKTRRDGSAFMESIGEKEDPVDHSRSEKRGKIIPLFDKNVTITSHPTKKADSD